MKIAIRMVIITAVFLALMAIGVGAMADELVTCKSIETGEIALFEVWCPIGWQEV